MNLTQNVDLVSGWDTFWTSISGGALSSIFTLLTAIGVLLIVFAVLKFVWQKRKGAGGGGQSGGLMYMVLIGLVLAGPQIFIPLILGLLTPIVNAATSFFETGTN